MMKRLTIILICSLIGVASLHAQRNVRKETHKGDNNYSEQRYGKAEERYKKAIELHNEAVINDRKKELKPEDLNKEAFFNLANTYYRQNKWDEAIKEYQNYSEIEADEIKQSKAWSNIGNSFLHKALEPKPADPAQQGKQVQADKLPRVEDLNKSMEAYKNALRRNPMDDEARYNLAVVQKMIQDQQDDQDKQNNQDQQDKQDQQQDQQDQQQDQQDKQDQQQDQQDQQDQQNDRENQMSRDNIEQILKALEQEEKETQSRVQQQKANEQKKKNARNRQQDKDW